MQDETLELVAEACPTLILKTDADNYMSVSELVSECSRELKAQARVLSPEGIAAMDFLDLACPELYRRLPSGAQNHMTLTEAARECDRELKRADRDGEARIAAHSAVAAFRAGRLGSRRCQQAVEAIDGVCADQMK